MKGDDDTAKFAQLLFEEGKISKDIDLMFEGMYFQTCVENTSSN